MKSASHSGSGALIPSRLTALAGMAAPVLFVSVFALEGWRRPGYHPASMFVSELSFGPRGWVQIGSFLLTGLLVTLFASGVAAHFSGGKAAQVGPTLLKILGFSLMASGPFVTDPSALFGQVSVHGFVHGLFGAVVFSLAPASCFVYFRQFRDDPGWKPFGAWSLLAGVFLVIGILLLKVSQRPQSDLYDWKGLIQRVTLLVFMGWLFAFAVRLFRRPGRTRSETAES